jgi:hypothetical protein
VLVYTISFTSNLPAITYSSDYAPTPPSTRITG